MPNTLGFPNVLQWLRLLHALVLHAKHVTPKIKEIPKTREIPKLPETPESMKPKRNPAGMERLAKTWIEGNPNGDRTIRRSLGQNVLLQQRVPRSSEAGNYGWAGCGNVGEP